MTEDAQYEVVWPSAPRAFDAVAVAPNTNSNHAGTTNIAFMWDFVFRGDEIFEIIQSVLPDHIPNARFHGHEQFGDIHGPNEAQFISGLPTLLEQIQAHAVIIGVGA